MIIAIAGGTGSGKTTLARRVSEQYPGGVTVLCHDSYYRSHDDLTYSERAALNYDHPDAFETELYAEHLRQLNEGHPVRSPVYDYVNHTRSDETVRVEPAPVIIAEGILVLAVPEIRELADIRIFVDTDADERVLRRVKRDVEKRGRTVASVAEQYLSTVKPMHDLYVEPSRKYADIIVVGGKNIVALDILTQKISQILGGNKNEQGVSP